MTVITVNGQIVSQTIQRSNEFGLTSMEVFWIIVGVVGVFAGLCLAVYLFCIDWKIWWRKRNSKVIGEYSKKKGYGNDKTKYIVYYYKALNFFYSVYYDKDREEYCDKEETFTNYDCGININEINNIIYPKYQKFVIKNLIEKQKVTYLETKYAIEKKDIDRKEKEKNYFDLNKYYDALNKKLNKLLKG